MSRSTGWTSTARPPTSSRPARDRPSCCSTAASSAAGCTGHGRSPVSPKITGSSCPTCPACEPRSGLDATELASWLTALLRLTGAESPTLVAHSLVGTLAVRFAADRGHLLGRLVLCGVPGIGPYRLPPGLLLGVVRSGLRPSEANFERFLRWPFLDADRTRRRDPEWFAAFSAYLRSRSAVPSVRRTMRRLVRDGTKRVPDDVLESVVVPTALLWGRHDRMVPLRVAEAAQVRFGWPLHVVEDAGHVPFLEQPEAYVDTLTAVIGPP